MIYCTQCGKEMKDDTLYCTDCGLKLINKPEPVHDEISDASDPPIPSFTEAPMSDPPIQTAPLMASQAAAAPMMASQAAVAPMMAADDYDTAPSAPINPVPYRGIFPEAEPIERPQKSRNERPLRATHLKKVSGAYTFLNTGMGLILVLVLLCAVVFLGVVTPLFFSYDNWMNILKQCAFFALIAVAVVLTTRAKGPDISIGPAMGMSAVIIAQTMLMGGALMNGILLAASAALVLGLINGFAVVFFKTPAVIVTLASGIVVSGLSTALTQGQMFAVEFSDRVKYYAGTSPIGILILLGAVFLLTYLYHLLTKIGRPLSEREPSHSAVSYMFAYLASAEIAAAAGFVLLVRLQSVTSAVDLGYLAYIISVYALLTASKALDNRFVPVLFALIPGVIWGLLSNIFTLWGVFTYYQPVIYGVLMLVSLMIALLSHYKGKKSIVI